MSAPKLFNAHKTGYDARNNVVHICTDEAEPGFFVFKPRTGYRSARFKAITTKGLLAAFDEQIACGHLATVPVDEYTIIPKQQ